MPTRVDDLSGVPRCLSEVIGCREPYSGLSGAHGEAVGVVLEDRPGKVIAVQAMSMTVTSSPGMRSK
jgi:hypothetical protein